MNVWLCIPSKRPPEEAERVLSKWRAQGYKIALWRDADDTWTGVGIADRIQRAPYPGYAAACNWLIRSVLTEHDSSAEWFVTGGDDVEPDLNRTAEEIAAQCSDEFWRRWIMAPGMKEADLKRRTFGVMQPTGDRWGDAQGPYIDRVAGSPWIGREFARRMYGGNGPYWPEYTHMGVDEELQAVATKLGVFWQRPDLIHLHKHWGRPREGERIGQADRMPEFLKKANSPEEWKRYKRIFAERQAAGFPGHEPI